MTTMYRACPFRLCLCSNDASVSSRAATHFVDGDDLNPNETSRTSRTPVEHLPREREREREYRRLRPREPLRERLLLEKREKKRRFKRETNDAEVIHNFPSVLVLTEHHCPQDPRE